MNKESEQLKIMTLELDVSPSPLAARIWRGSAQCTATHICSMCSTETNILYAGSIAKLHLNVGGCEKTGTISLAPYTPLNSVLFKSKIVLFLCVHHMREMRQLIPFCLPFFGLCIWISSSSSPISGCLALCVCVCEVLAFSLSLHCRSVYQIDFENIIIIKTKPQSEYLPFHFILVFGILLFFQFFFSAPRVCVCLVANVDIVGCVDVGGGLACGERSICTIHINIYIAIRHTCEYYIYFLSIIGRTETV